MFTDATFQFLTELADNNKREWFTANQGRYEDHVKGPALRLIGDLAAPLAELNPRFQAGPRSLFRIYRDTRFSADKRPYKTSVGLLFRHENADKMHSPGYYLHLEPGKVFTGFGVWHPDSAMLGAIRDHIVEKPAAWTKASTDRAFREAFEMEGGTLTRPPKGYPADHPLVEDLKRKDFVAMKQLPESFVAEPELPERLIAQWSVGTPLMRFLCEAVGLEGG
jgi:uncharacterized protein (TIGR02453 family)